MMPLQDAHFGGFVRLGGEKAAARLLNGRYMYILHLTIPAKARLYGATSNRRVTCF